MRKYTRIGTFLLALVMCLTMLTAQAESELPEEVADLFTVKAWAHYAIANQPDMPENKAFAVMQEKSGYEAALLVMRNTKSETNVLVLAEKSSAQADWKITMRNWGAVEQGDAKSVLGRLVKLGPKPDVVVVDPPRAGIDAKVAQQLAEAAPLRLIYVSCNPATLARDVARLAPAFRLKAARPVDLFPQTPHVETVVLLERA